MSRQINLLNPALIRQRDAINARLLLWLSGAMLLLMLGIFAYARYQLQHLTAQRDQVAHQLQETQSQLTQLSQQYAPRQPSKPLQDSVAMAEGRLASHQRLLTFLQADHFGSQAGFSNYMRAFSRRTMPNLWLTGFAVDQDANEMTIHGRALQPDLVPRYIGQLGEDPALKGRTFSTLSISQPTEDAAARPAAGAQAALPPLPFIEFELRSSRHAEASPQAGGHAP